MLSVHQQEEGGALLVVTCVLLSLDEGLIFSVVFVFLNHLFGSVLASCAFIILRRFYRGLCLPSFSPLLID